MLLRPSRRKTIPLRQTTPLIHCDTRKNILVYILQLLLQMCLSVLFHSCVDISSSTSVYYMQEIAKFVSNKKHTRMISGQCNCQQYCKLKGVQW